MTGATTINQVRMYIRITWKEPHDRVPKEKNVDPYRKKIPRGKGTAQELLAVTSHRVLSQLFMRRQSLARSNFCRPISALFRQNTMGGGTTATQSPSTEVLAEEVSWHPRSSCSTFQSRSTAFLLWYTCSHVRSYCSVHKGSTYIVHRKKGEQIFWIIWLPFLETDNLSFFRRKVSFFEPIL